MMSKRTNLDFGKFNVIENFNDFETKPFRTKIVLETSKPSLHYDAPRSGYMHFIGVLIDCLLRPSGDVIMLFEL